MYLPGNDAVLDVTADEANGSVTTALRSTGYSESYPAAFTPTEVRFQNRLLSYVVSRTDLSIQRTIKMISSMDTGSCRLGAAP